MQNFIDLELNYVNALIKIWHDMHECNAWYARNLECEMESKGNEEVKIDEIWMHLLCKSIIMHMWGMIIYFKQS